MDVGRADELLIIIKVYLSCTSPRAYI